MNKRWTVGQKVVVYPSRDTNPLIVETVSRVTKQFVVLGNGDKYGLRGNAWGCGNSIRCKWIDAFPGHERFNEQQEYRAERRKLRAERMKAFNDAAEIREHLTQEHMARFSLEVKSTAQEIVQALRQTYSNKYACDEAYIVEILNRFKNE